MDYMMDWAVAMINFIKKPFYQSLVLSYLTMFVLGCQVTIWCGKIDGVWVGPAMTGLLVLYLFKNMAVLVKETKEVNGGDDNAPTSGRAPLP